MIDAAQSVIQQSPEPDPDSCNPNEERQDAHPNLCATVKKHGHCGLHQYKVHCRVTCNPCKNEGKPDGVDSGKDNDAESEASDAVADQERNAGERNADADGNAGTDDDLADSKEDTISQLETELSNSIDVADKAMHHAHKTEHSARSRLSDDENDDERDNQ